MGSRRNSASSHKSDSSVCSGISTEYITGECIENQERIRLSSSLFFLGLIMMAFSMLKWLSWCLRKKEREMKEQKGDGREKEGKRPNASLASGCRSFAVRLIIQFSGK